MTKLHRDGLLVARLTGTRLLLAGASGSRPSFEGPSERTIFFRPEAVDRELKKHGIDPSRVELKPASFEAHIG